MSIFGSMKTAVSGMSAQANRLSTVSDNIANANTVGYKAVSTSFSSLVLPSSSGNYNSGGVQTSVRQAISQQGDISYTTSDYDLAISGDGFFIVQSADGTPVLTRAGDFSVDSDGNLVNGAGFTLMTLLLKLNKIAHQAIKDDPGGSSRWIAGLYIMTEERETDPAAETASNQEIDE